MKEFIYLDSSFLHSFIAQIYGGLPSTVTNETQESRTQTHTDTIQTEMASELHGSLNAVIAKMDSKINPKETRGESISLAQLDVGKEIISKQLHDNAVDELIEYLRKHNLLIISPDSFQINSYILYSSTFKVIDMEYLRAFTRREFGQLLRLNKKKQASNQQNLNIPIDMIGKILDFFSTILPSDIFIKQERVLSPLKKEYLRIQPKELLFKYSEQTTVSLLGRITRQIDSTAMQSDFEFTSLLSISDMMTELANGLMTQFEVVEEGEYIVSPIAIFFESI